ncbi:AAA family ATPase [Acidobacteriota bacterium]
MLSKKLLTRLMKKTPFLFTESEARNISSAKEADIDFGRLSLRITESLIRLTTVLFLSKLRQAGCVEEKTQAAIDRSLDNLTIHRLIEIQRTILADRSFPFHRIFSLDFKGRDLLQLLLDRYLDDLSSLSNWYQKPAQVAAEGGKSTPLSMRNDFLEFIVTYFKSELRFAQPVQENDILTKGPFESQRLVLVTRSRDRAIPLDPLLRQTEHNGLEVFGGTGLGGVEYVPLAGGGPSWCVEPKIIRSFVEFFLHIGAYRQAITLVQGDRRGDTNGKTVKYATHCVAGQEHMRKAKFHLAVLEFDKALRLRDDILLLHFHLSKAHDRLNNTNKAIRTLEGLAESQPDSEHVYEVIADLYIKKKAHEDARRMLEFAIEKNPSNFRAQDKLKALKRSLHARDRTHSPDGEAKKQGDANQEAAKAQELLVDLTEEARKGRLSSAIGREREIAELIEILCCQNRNNPLIIGEPGVGKTAMVEELANRIVAGRVPDKLMGYKIYLMSIATILAGAKFRGQFEERILGLIKELQEERCILFLDDMHTMISTGVTRGGSLDTSSLLKPALIRGDVQAIGATTFEEYRLNMEKETSLMRCFQVVNTEEPDWETIRLILEDNIVRFSEYHNVEFDDFDRIEAARLIKVCIKDRLLPDIAINVFDRAAAKVSLRSPDADESAQSFPTVRRMDVIEVLSDISGVPVSKLSRSQSERFMHMEEILAERLIGQEEAINAVSKVIRTTKMDLDLNPQRPDGVFLFVGPSGVGKTELARSLADFLFGDEEKLIRIDMSEYMERISSSRLIGAAPGYVGYNDQNQLADMVRKTPYSLVLLDEIEKADDQMINIFLQVFDAGRLTDGKGRTVEFNNTTVIMTSNLGTELFSRTPVGYSKNDKESAARVTHGELMRGYESPY